MKGATTKVGQSQSLKRINAPGESTRRAKHKKMKTIKNYFWNHEYRHEMRDAKPSEKMEVFKAFKEMGLPVDGKSDLHQEIIDATLGNFIIVDPNPERETPEDQFTRIAEMRISRALKNLELVARLGRSNPGSYTPEQIKKIDNAVSKELTKTIKTLNRHLNPEPKELFKF